MHPFLPTNLADIDLDERLRRARAAPQGGRRGLVLRRLGHRLFGTRRCPSWVRRRPANFTRLALAVIVLMTVGAPAYAGRLDETEEKYPNVVPPLFKFGARGTGEGELLAPRSLAATPNGEFLIADCERGSVERFDAEGRYVAASVDGMSCPMALEIDSTGATLVLDSGNDQIQRLEGGQRSTVALRNGPNLVDLRDIALDEERHRIYLADGAADKIHVFALDDGRHIASFGDHGSEPGEFSCPSAVAVSERGEIVVADKYNDRVQVFSPDRFSFQREIGRRGSYPGELAAPEDVVVAGTDLFVADAINHRVQVFNLETGRLQYHFGRHPIHKGGHDHRGEGRTHYPFALAVDETRERVIVCEKFEGFCQVFSIPQITESYKPVNRVSAYWDKYPFFWYRTGCKGGTHSPKQAFETARSLGIKVPQKPKALEQIEGTGPIDFLVTTEEDLHKVTVMQMLPSGGAKTLSAFGAFGEDPGKLKTPFGANLDNTLRVWVADSLNHRLQVFDLDGNVLQVIGRQGTNPGEFIEPGSPVVDQEGNVYVADSGNNRIQVFSPRGEFLRSWGKHGSGPGEFEHPIDMALSPDGRHLYTLEMYNARIQTFTIDGTFVKQWGNRGTGPGEFLLPMHIAAAPNGDVVVSDDALDRIHRFSSDGGYIRSFGRSGSDRGELKSPQGVAVDPKGHIWVIDYGNHRGQTFDGEGRWLNTWAEQIIAVKEDPRAFSPSLTSGVLGGLGLLGISTIAVRRRHRARN